MCVSPVTYAVLCVRFIFFVRFCRSLNRLQRSAENATRDTGGWLNLMKLNTIVPPGKDFHLARYDKLYLPHAE